MTASSVPSEVASLQDRVILVTGAHGGLGSEVARACARAGAQVVLLGRKLPRLNRLYDSIVQDGGQAVLYPLDLSGASPDDYATLAERIGDELGALHGIVHAAAEFPGLTPLSHAKPMDLALAVHVNLTAPCWLTQACLPLLQRVGDGCVLWLINQPAGSGKAYWGGYGMAQAALQSLVPMLQAEQGLAGVRITGLQAPPMRTALRARAYTENTDRAAVDPARVADACVQLLSPAAADRRGSICAFTDAGLRCSA